MRRLFVAVGVCAGVGLGSTAYADRPEKVEFEFFDEFVDTRVCAAEPWGFDVQASQHQHWSVTFFGGPEGFSRGINHIDLDFTISANGITLTERATFNVFFDDAGRREVGLLTHIQSPGGGIVLLDAGQLVFDAGDNLVRAPGRHPQFFGASFCDALVPTG